MSPNISFRYLQMEESSPKYKLYGYGLCMGNPTLKIALQYKVGIPGTVVSNIVFSCSSGCLGGLLEFD